MLGRIRKFIKQETSLLLFKTLLLPVLDYGDVIYGVASQVNVERVQKIQNAACRVVLMAHKRTHIAELHSTLNLMYLRDRRAFHLATFAYKCVNGLAPTYLTVFFEPVEVRHGINTRAVQNHDMVFKKGRTQIGDKAF